jgi:hypothetical protein
MTEAFPPPSTAKKVIAGIVASVASGLLGGIVLGLVIGVGLLIFGEVIGESVISEVLKTPFVAILIYAFGGGVFGLIFGIPYAAALGHLCLWLTRNNGAKLMPVSLALGAIVTALTVGGAIVVLQLRESDLDFSGLATIVTMFSICGALAGTTAAFIFVVIRRGILKPAKPSLDDEFNDDDDVNETGNPNHA